MARYSEYREIAPMYNEDLKKRYIEERNKEVVMPSSYLENQFGKLYDSETELKKDCSNFTKYDIIDYYKSLNTTSYDGLVVLNSQLSLYSQWCLQQNLVRDSQNHYLEVSADEIRGCINKALLSMKFITRETILQWCEQLPNYRDQFILLGLYEGLKSKNFKDLWALRPEDVKGNIATLYSGRKITLSNKLVNIVDGCVEEDTYYSISGTGSKTMKLLDRGNVIKEYPNTKDDVSEFQKSRQIFNAISRILNYFGVQDIMSANSIYESAKLEMIKELSRKYNMTNKELIYSPYIKEVEDKYDCTIVKSVYVNKYVDYLD